MRGKVHHHEEQFDGFLHANCHTLDSDVRFAADPRIVGTDDFEKTPREKRCRKCANLWWIKGGEPA